MLSETILSNVIDKIVHSDYNSIEDLIERSPIPSIDETRAFLDIIMKKWNSNDITPASLHVCLKFAQTNVDNVKIQISPKNRIPIPICYYSSYLPLGTSYIYTNLKTHSLAMKLFQLDKNDKHLRTFIVNRKPPLIIFSINHFVHVKDLKKIIPFIHDKGLKVIIGGIAFIYDKSQKINFPECDFPHDVDELYILIKETLKERKK